MIVAEAASEFPGMIGEKIALGTPMPCRSHHREFACEA